MIFRRRVSDLRHDHQLSQTMEEKSATLSPHKDNNDVRTTTKADTDAARVNFILARATVRQQRSHPSLSPIATEGCGAAGVIENSLYENHNDDEHHLEPKVDLYRHTNDHAPNYISSAVNAKLQTRTTTVRRPVPGGGQRWPNGSRSNRPKNAHNPSATRRTRLSDPKVLAKQRRRNELQQVKLTQQRSFIELAGISTRELGHPEDDVVRCFCGDTTEDGLMVQCEQCQAWQHSHCLDYDDMNSLPSSYICVFCEHLPHMMYNVRYSARDHATCTQQLVNVDSDMYAVPRSVQYDKSASATTGSTSSSSNKSLSSGSASASVASPPASTFADARHQNGGTTRTFHGLRFPSSSASTLPSFLLSDCISHHSMSTTPSSSTTSSLLEVQQPKPPLARTAAPGDLDTVDGLNKFNLEIQAFMREISVMVEYYKRKFADININAFDPTKLHWVPSATTAAEQQKRNDADRKSFQPHMSADGSLQNHVVFRQVMPTLGPTLVPSNLMATTSAPMMNGDLDAHANSDRLNRKRPHDVALSSDDDISPLKTMHRNLAALGVELGCSNKTDSRRLRHYAEKLLAITPPSPQRGIIIPPPLLSLNNNSNMPGSMCNGKSDGRPLMHFAQERLKLLSILREVHEDAQASELQKCLNAVSKLSAFARHVLQRTMDMRERFYAHNQQYLVQPTTVLAKTVGVGSRMHTVVNRLRNMQGACKTLTRLYALSSAQSSLSNQPPAVKAAPPSAPPQTIFVPKLPTELFPATSNVIQRLPSAFELPPASSFTSFILPSSSAQQQQQQQQRAHNGSNGVRTSMLCYADTAVDPFAVLAARKAAAAAGMSLSAVSAPPLSAVSLPSPSLSSKNTLLQPPLSLSQPAVISRSGNNNISAAIGGITAPADNVISSVPCDDAAGHPVIVPRVDRSSPLLSSSLHNRNVVSVLALPDGCMPNAMRRSDMANGSPTTATTTLNPVKRRRKRRRSPSPMMTMDAFYNTTADNEHAGCFDRDILARTLVASINAGGSGDSVVADVSDDDKSSTSVGIKRFNAVRAWYEHRQTELFYNTQLPRRSAAASATTTAKSIAKTNS